MEPWQASVNQAREETGYRGPDIPRTPNAIGEALRIDRRAEFYNAVAAAGDDNTLEGVISLWWPQAVIDFTPDDPTAEAFIDLTFAHYADTCPRDRSAERGAEGESREHCSNP